jgi:hypothetical protein
MKQLLALLLFVVFASAKSYCAHTIGTPSSFVLRAITSESSIKVDGILDEPGWTSSDIAHSFTENDPVPGTPSSQRTEVRVLYDNDAIYIGAMMFDTSPDSILSQLTARDELGNADYFGVWFSCFRDGINAFQFVVTPSGIQLDAQLSVLGKDPAWNAVWQCNTSKNENGWTAEFKIPYSALRFPDIPEQTWDVNFIRYIRRTRELSYWHPVDPKVDGLVNQSGQLSGIMHIKPPPRLFFYPYSSAYYQKQSFADGTNENTTFWNGGMDVKYGISDAFTVDLTLIPDFGQVLSDNLVLNLSPFEVQFVENRQFFTEGTELFNKGNLFYSRRVGGTPVNRSALDPYLNAGYEIRSQDSEAQLINATKLSGRNKNGLGLGFFNALSAPAYATLRNEAGEDIRVEINPLTNYNILVADQNLPNNSFITLINTSVLRSGSTYDANVTGTEFRIRTKDNRFQWSGGGAYSHQNFGQRTNENGFRASSYLNKLGGNFIYGGGTEIMSDRFNPNDLGFLANNNTVITQANLAYRIFTPFGRFNSMYSELNVFYDRMYLPATYAGVRIENETGFVSRKFQFYQLWCDINPGYRYDYFEPRTAGRYYRLPSSANAGGYVSSDYRKRLAIDASIWAGRMDEPGRDNFNWRLAPRFRVNDRLMLTYVWSRQNSYNEVGWVDTRDNGEIILGRRDRITHTHVATANYIFTNRMGLTCRLRHYWSFVKYSSMGILDEEGIYNEIHNVFDDAEATAQFNGNFNAFTIDMVFRWVFSPGSELSLVWKNNITNFSNTLIYDYADNLERTLELPQINSFSLRVLYFIDYMNFRRKENFIKN